jgi:adenylate cyclase
MVRKLFAGLALGVGSAVIVLLLALTGWLDLAELKSYDRRMLSAATPESVSKEIVLVEVNDTSIRDLQPLFGRFPWPRIAYSYLIDYLHRAPARIVAMDILLPEPDNVQQYDIGGQTWKGNESDHELARSVRDAGNVIMLADAVDEGLVSGEKDRRASRWRDPGYRPGPHAEHRPVVLPPYQELADAASGLGHNFVILDQDGPLRRIAPFIENDGKFLPSLGLAAALRAAGIRPEEVSGDGTVLRVRDRKIPLIPTYLTDAYDNKRKEHWGALINYQAPALLPDLKRPYRAHEFRHLFLSEQQLIAGVKPLVDPTVFKDKIVFVGLSSAAGLNDVFTTPVSDDKSGKMPGIQMHASVADSVLANRFIRLAPPVSRIATVVITSTAIGMLSAFLPFSGAAVVALVIVGAWTGFAVAAFKNGLWLNMVQPQIAGAIALFAGTAYQYFVEGVEKRKMKRLFGRYVSKDVYEQLVAHPELAELGGKRREMTVLFSDIRGFTSVTERGDPEELVAQLNEYFSKMVEIVFEHQGTVDKFVGDMVMALFGAPLDDPDHAEHAVQAAIHMVEELGRMNKGWKERGMVPLDIGIGINSGDMIAGNIGSSAIMSYTVIGDNVNLGSRLESLNKDYKTRIIMSDATRTRLSQAYDTRPLGDVVVKGKSKPVAIFEIKVPAPLVQEVQIT